MSRSRLALRLMSIVVIAGGVFTTPTEALAGDCSSRYFCEDCSMGIPQANNHLCQNHEPSCIVSGNMCGYDNGACGEGNGWLYCLYGTQDT